MPAHRATGVREQRLSPPANHTSKVASLQPRSAMHFTMREKLVSAVLIWREAHHNCDATPMHIEIASLPRSHSLSKPPVDSVEMIQYYKTCSHYSHCRWQDRRQFEWLEQMIDIGSCSGSHTLQFAELTKDHQHFFFTFPVFAVSFDVRRSLSLGLSPFLLRRSFMAGLPRDMMKCGKHSLEHFEVRLRNFENWCSLKLKIFNWNEAMLECAKMCDRYASMAILWVWMSRSKKQKI